MDDIVIGNDSSLEYDKLHQGQRTGGGRWARRLTLALILFVLLAVGAIGLTVIMAIMNVGAVGS